MYFKNITILFSVILILCLNLSESCYGTKMPLNNIVSFSTIEYSSENQANLLAKFQEQVDILQINFSNGNSGMIFFYVLLFVIVMGIFFFRLLNYKHKQLIALNEKEFREQLIKELKTDHQLLASRAVLMGEELERGRISRDLHDGLGGMLSAIKLGLSNIRESNNLPSGMKEKIDVVLNQLNTSISELRSIAQNLMPEALTNFGLKEALNDYCSHLGTHKNVEISFYFYGELIRIDQSIENALFRIAQEAINNALKHSNATKIIVQLIQDESWINLTIQDNGEGFDLEKVRDKKSGGLKNMRDRAEVYDGRFHIDTKPGEGTEIIIDLIYNTEN